MVEISVNGMYVMAKGVIFNRDANGIALSSCYGVAEVSESFQQPGSLS